MSRPLGPLGRALLGALGCRELTARDLANELRRPVREVVRQLHRLLIAGRIDVACHVHVPHAKRPVARYRLKRPHDVFAAWRMPAAIVG